VPEADLACSAGDLWWFDSCGNPDRLAQGCSHGCQGEACLECVPDCSGRECGLDPNCHVSCGICAGNDSCDAAGRCGPWCLPGETRCTPDDLGFEACGPDPIAPASNTFGSRISCLPGEFCNPAEGHCVHTGCNETEVMILLDRSSSMLSSGTWEWVQGGLMSRIAFVESLQRLGFRQFPGTNGACSVGPVVSMAMNNASAIEAAMLPPANDAATPIEASLQGFLASYGDPSDGQAVLLITDGDETCGTQAGAIAAAAQLFRAGVRVYVLAVTGAANRVFLDQLAEAGGTGAARPVVSEMELRAAIDAVFQDLYACVCTPGYSECREGAIQTCGVEGVSWDVAPCAHNHCYDTDRCAIPGEGLWTYRSSGDHLYCAPAIGPGGLIYLTHYDYDSDWVSYYYSRIDAVGPDGLLRWSRQFSYSYPVLSSPAIGPDGSVVVGYAGGRVLAYNPDGSTKWALDGLSAINGSSPAIAANGTIYVGSQSGNLYAVGSDGTRSWTFQAAGRVDSSPAIGSDGKIYFGCDNGMLYALHPAGTLAWSFQTAGPIDSSPAIGPDGTIYVGSDDDKLYAIRPDGTLAWGFQTGGDVNSSPVIGPAGNIYVGSDDQRLYAVRPDGSLLWSYRADGLLQEAPLIDANGSIYIGSGDGTLHVLGSNGTWLRDIALNSPVRSSPTLSPDGVLYVGTLDGRLHAIFFGAPLAGSGWPKFHLNLSNSGSP
jgi:outer membrane protein assembly factor BamB